MIYGSPRDWDNDEEYQSLVADEQERELARRCGMGAFEASNYTPAELQEKLRKLNAPVSNAIATDKPIGRMICKSFSLPDGRRWKIWDADCSICPIELRGINNPTINPRACAKI